MRSAYARVHPVWFQWEQTSLVWSSQWHSSSVTTGVPLCCSDFLIVCFRQRMNSKAPHQRAVQNKKRIILMQNGPRVCGAGYIKKVVPKLHWCTTKRWFALKCLQRSAGKVWIRDSVLVWEVIYSRSCSCCFSQCRRYFPYSRQGQDGKF